MYPSVKPGQMILQSRDIVPPFVKGQKYIILSIQQILKNNLHSCYVGTFPDLEHYTSFFINKDFQILDEIINPAQLNFLLKKEIAVKLELALDKFKKRKLSSVFSFGDILD